MKLRVFCKSIAPQCTFDVVLPDAPFAAAAQLILMDGFCANGLAIPASNIAAVFLMPVEPPTVAAAPVIVHEAPESKQ